MKVGDYKRRVKHVTYDRKALKRKQARVRAQERREMLREVVSRPAGEEPR